MHTVMMELSEEEEAQRKGVSGGGETDTVAAEERTDIREKGPAEAEDQLQEVASLDLFLKAAANNNRLSPMSNPTPPPPAAAGAQLTIFYAGSISVFDAVPPEKAQAIMFIAAAAAAANATASANNKNITAPMLVGPNPAAAAASPVLSRSPSLQSSSAAVPATQTAPQLLPNANSSLCKLQAEFPIARRHSLQRFLEKRRDRFVSKAPYASGKTSEGMEAAMEGKLRLS